MGGHGLAVGPPHLGEEREGVGQPVGRDLGKLCRGRLDREVVVVPPDQALVQGVGHPEVLHVALPLGIEGEDITPIDEDQVRLGGRVVEVDGQDQHRDDQQEGREESHGTGLFPPDGIVASREPPRLADQEGGLNPPSRRRSAVGRALDGPHDLLELAIVVLGVA